MPSADLLKLPIKVLFHSNKNGIHCPDGFAAAYAIWVVYRDSPEYIPCVYGETAPEINPGDIVFVVDFSFPRETLLRWIDIATVVVLDHHKTAQAELADLPFARFDMNKSGGQLAWEFIHQSQNSTEWRNCPPLINYIADRDLWRKELPHTEEVARALSTFPLDFVVWDALANMPNYVEVMRRIGEPLQKAHLAAVERGVESAEMGYFDKYAAILTMLNDPAIVSDVLNQLCIRNPEYPFAVNITESADRFEYSLRSVGDFDVSEVAKKLGGGGHKNAAGCSSPK